MFEQVAHVNLEASKTPQKKVNIFGIFEVQHTNRGRTKYSICNSHQITLQCGLGSSKNNGKAQSKEHNCL